MPYTAPLKQSPSAQHIEHSDLTTRSCPSSPQLGRNDSPKRSRLYSTTAYTRKHRRSPSTSKSFVAPPPTNPSKLKHVVDSHSSIRQSPPPISEARMPPGAVISPPESAPNSSDDEASSYRKRDGLQLEELEEAVRSIEQRRVSSPERQLSDMKPSSSHTTPPAPINGKKPAHPPLSKEARKISHSRSATETSISHKQEEALTSSPEDSERDDEPPKRHPMVRKKSGELVRPALRPPSARRRPSSMPGTPTYSKAVHFDSQLEHIRHFLQVDKPQAVSAGTSPVDDYDAEGEFPFGENGSEIRSFEWDIRLPNFPHDLSRRNHQRVRLERLYLSSDKTTLVGMVAVANLAFQKLVAARFTFDSWKTISEVTAEYHDDVRRKQIADGYDRFSFSIKLDEQANLERKTMLICIRYNVDGQEFWDNNSSMNYQVKFLKVPMVRGEPLHVGGKPAPTARVSLPRSRTFASFGARPHSMPPSFDDFSHMDDYLSFGRPSKGAKDRSLCEDASHDEESVAPIRRDKQSHQVFGSRYDFETSLTAAMRNKAPHDRTTLTARAKSENGPDSKKQASLGETDLTVGKCPPATEASPSSSLSDNSRPSSLVSSKPHRESSVYKELVDKYCFFGAGGSRGPVAGSDLSSTRRDSSSSSGSVSPCSSPVLSPRPDDSRDSGSRNAPSSPNQFGYPYLQHMQHHFLQDAHTPTVIRG